MIRLPGQLQVKLDRSLATRKLELAHLRATILRAGDAAPVLRRSGITLIYAHWEGFFREACRGYLELVASQPRHVHTLTLNFQAMFLRGAIQRLGASGHTADHMQLIELVQEQTVPPSSEKRLVWRRMIRLGSMKPERIRVVFAELGLDYEPFARKEHQILRRILKVRNLVAHGHGVPVQEAMYEELHRGIVDLLDILKDQILDVSSNTGFSR